MKKTLGIIGTVGLVAVLVAGGILMMRLRQFRASVEQLKSDGYPVSIADIQQANSGNGLEALDLLKRLLPKLELFETAMWNIDEEALSRPVDDEMIASFDRLVEECPDLFPLLKEFSRQTELGFDVEGDSQEFLDGLMKRELIPRSCARVLAWKTKILAAQGQPDDAVLNGLQIFRIARLFDHDPMLISQLVTIAARGIAIAAVRDVMVDYPVSPEVRDQLNKELESHDALSGYQNCLLGERAFGIETLSEMGVLHLAFGGKGYLDIVEHEINYADKEGFEQVVFEQSKNAEWMNHSYGAMLFPAFQQVRDAVFRTRSQIRALRIVNALQAQNDAEPKTVSSEYLVGIGVPKLMTLDTMNGEPMKVRRVDRGWVVYSVGPDLKDDGGDLDNRKDIGIGWEFD